MGNIVEFGARTSIERQAREWLIRMDGDEPLSDAETEALWEWMSRSALHREELKRLARFWSESNILTELGVCRKSETRERNNGGMHWVVPVTVAASAVLASIILVWWSVHRLDESVNGTYGTVIGQQKTISLSDGSSIQLNTDSQVQVVYGGGSREIRLLRGEALFFAMPDSNRPFEVYAADSVVRAVGTAFAIHLEGNTVDVTVTKGTVDVGEVGSAQATASPEPVETARSNFSLGRLKAGEMTHVVGGSDHLEVHRLAEPELQRRMAWHEGYLAFSGEPLSEVLEQVNRYSRVTLEIGDPRLASIAIGGRFRIGDLDAILDVLHTSFGIQAHQVNERSIRLESETARKSPRPLKVGREGVAARVR